MIAVAGDESPASSEHRSPGRAELVALLGRHGLSPSRALGQNFLADPNTAERIVRLSGVAPGDRVVEVGAGLGSLTVALARSGARVLALELDRRLVPLLEEITASHGVRVVQGDAMSCDWDELLGAEPWRLVANLPYNIAAPLLLDLLAKVPAIEKMFVMVQREVAERLAADPGSAAYGAVSLRRAYFATARLAGVVPASVFLPRPRVESALLELVRLAEPPVSREVASFGEIDRLVSLGFAVRRKMLRRSLAPLVGEETFARAGVDSARRPEELSLPEWGRLAAALAGRPVGSGT